MKLISIAAAFLIFACSGKSSSDPLVAKYLKQAENITIIRDSWGIPHIYGKTDADVVFGLMYAQCEDNFNKVERAYLSKLGRLSEIDGEGYLYQDLLSRMVYDSVKAINDYNNSPAWLRTLCNAFADGINFYLNNHPDKAELLKKFQPWWPLLNTDGAYVALQTGGLELNDISTMYDMPGQKDGSFLNRSNDLTGSNAFALGPAKTASKNAMLYINPHVTFHFRMEAHMVSEEGLNAYGTITWGQFFVFQGFNEHCGWMHTSSAADAADIYIETITLKNDGYYSTSGTELKKISEKNHLFRYKKDGRLWDHSITSFYSHNGPVLGKRNDHWLSLKTNSHSLEGLVQSWQRTKAKDLEQFKTTMTIRANPSTNTMYADDKGNIAYWHGNYIPKRNPGQDWSIPLDGSILKNEWNGIHELEEMIHISNPRSGYLQNCNSTPFTAAGRNSLDEKKFPDYMAPDGENFRSQFAINELEKNHGYTLDKLIGLGYNNYLSAFDTLLPPLFKAYDALAPTHQLYVQLSEPVKLLKAWNKRSSSTSIETSIAVYWAYRIIYNHQLIENQKVKDQTLLFSLYVESIPATKRLELLSDAMASLQRSFGNWKIPWGEVNRYQRISGISNQEYSDNAESLPVPYTSSLFGSLPAFESMWPKTKKGYAYAGNSFIAAVEFGPRIKAKAIAAGGQSFDPDSKHFQDQAELFLQGKFRDVFFYREDVEKNKERKYHPGD